MAQAFRALEKSGRAWMLLRGENDLLHPSGDIDILVAGELLPELDGLMSGIGFRRVQAAGHGSHRFYFTYADHEWVKLDIVSEVSFGPFQQWRTSLASGCLSRRIQIGPLWLPATADQAWLQLLHLFLDKGKVAPDRRDVAGIAGAIASVDDDIAAFVDTCMGCGTAPALLDLVLEGNWDESAAFAARMKKALTARRPMSTRVRGLTNRLLRLSGARIQGRGVTVGVMAPDGAGKTTLLRTLSEGVPLPSRYVYMGMWGAGRWDVLLRRIPGGRTGKKVFRIFRGGLAARCHGLLGRLVLLDRVAYDALLPGTPDRSLAGRLSNALALRVGPAPDVLLVLDVPGEVMFARKGEHSAEILEGWRQGYLQLADRLPMARILDADQPQGQVAALATEIVWHSISPMAPPADEPASVDDEVLPLHLWRLLDWRFLLPDLQPRSVGYGGNVGRSMKSALRLLDPHAAPVRPGGGASKDKLFDLVLLADPDRGLFEAAAGAVRPGGWICISAKRSLWSRGSGPRTLAGWKRELARSGFRDVSVYWHAPTLDRAARMVPTSSSRAIKDTLALHRGVRYGLAKAVAARIALSLRVFDAAIPEGTVTGRRPLRESGHGLH
ncbi:hypothetical protein SPF06_18245 [Sinomonas sp. JGH33]|uniref:Thymidylate kinase n=1 Tax=Sinomonas terricola TaxID=3110330 RepID=A0ABU5TAR7_9MICC|nr:hypothetical protein [Sinomonas sp. JGH33]MEA5456668.1 hypothetical protein [Sinomonas sp. JGH33]